MRGPETDGCIIVRVLVRLVERWAGYSTHPQTWNALQWETGCTGGNASSDEPERALVPVSRRSVRSDWRTSSLPPPDPERWSQSSSDSAQPPPERTGYWNKTISQAQFNMPSVIQSQLPEEFYISGLAVSLVLYYSQPSQYHVKLLLCS